VAAYDTGAAGKPRAVWSFVTEFPFRFTIERASVHPSPEICIKKSVSSFNLL
jgi:hypothetical protein